MRVRGVRHSIPVSNRKQFPCGTQPFGCHTDLFLYISATVTQGGGVGLGQRHCDTVTRYRCELGGGVGLGQIAIAVNYQPGISSDLDAYVRIHSYTKADSAGFAGVAGMARVLLCFGDPAATSSVGRED